jgi:hypothetical protein
MRLNQSVKQYVEILNNLNLCFYFLNEKLHAEKQHQLKILLQKYEHLFDGTLGEFNMDPLPMSLQMMDPNF